MHAFTIIYNCLECSISSCIISSTSIKIKLKDEVGMAGPKSIYTNKNCRDINHIHYIYIPTLAFIDIPINVSLFMIIKHS